MVNDMVECPSCGEELRRQEDRLGATYQCVNLSCLGFFEEDEIKEPTNG